MYVIFHDDKWEKTLAFIVLYQSHEGCLLQLNTVHPKTPVPALTSLHTIYTANSSHEKKYTSLPNPKGRP